MQDLEHLRQSWKDTIHGKGGNCPVCERFGKVYSRGINKTMAASLKWLYEENMKKGMREWIDVPNTAGKAVVRSNQLPTLRWWGLVERQLPDPSEKKHLGKYQGMWRITLRGMDFVEGKVLVPKKVSTYNGEVVAHSDETTDFASCLNVKFDYQEVLQESHEHIGESLFPALV